MYPIFKKVLLFIFLILFIIYLRIKIKYGFWILQPVYHIYNLHYIFYKNCIISNKLPIKNKYVDSYNIYTKDISQLSNYYNDKITHFIQNNYLQDNDNIYNPNKKNIFPYFLSHESKCYISIYEENIKLYNINNNNVISDNNIISIITGRPLYILFNKENISLNVYYIDYLCVNLNNRKNGVAPKMIQTHYYNQSYNNKNIVVNLFKRENELTGIVPLCVYSTYGFNIQKWLKPVNLNDMYIILEINKQNIHLLKSFIDNNNSKFDVFIYNSYSNILELLETNNIFIYTILFNDNIISAYFFRKSCVYIENNAEVLDCFASINNCNNNDIFILGFKNCFTKIIEKYEFKYLSIENISHNNLLINNILIKQVPIVISPTAYFLYNYIYHTINANNMFIIN